MGGDLSRVDLGSGKKAVAVSVGERPPYYVSCDPLIMCCVTPFFHVL